VAAIAGLVRAVCDDPNPLRGIDRPDPGDGVQPISH
jgi:hypothetical protein